jgi:hypothetical protein
MRPEFSQHSSQLGLVNVLVNFSQLSLKMLYLLDELEVELPVNQPKLTIPFIRVVNWSTF